MADLDPETLLFELTLKERALKSEWADGLNRPVVLEGGYLWGEGLLARVPLAMGLHGGAFFSPTGKVEVFLSGDFKEAVNTVFQALGLKPHYVSRPGLGFTYPRVVSMLVNEAHLALEDGLAEPASIDAAMKSGVNHPLGPFEWKDKIGAGLIVKLLDELRSVTGDARYRVSPKLRREAL